MAVATLLLGVYPQPLLEVVRLAGL